MPIRQYIGARYVPKFFENPNNTSEWLPNVIYEPLTIVTYATNSYTSKKTVPASVGDPSNNPDYWVATGNYNAFIQQLQDDFSDIQNDFADLQTSVTNLDIHPITEFGAVCDGVTDDSAAVADAITYAVAHPESVIKFVGKVKCNYIHIYYPCHIDFNDAEIIPAGGSGRFLEILYTFNFENNKITGTYDNININAGNNNTYSELIHCGGRDAHFNSVRVTNSDNPTIMVVDDYDGQVFQYIRLHGCETDPATKGQIGLRINRNDCFFNYIEVNKCATLLYLDVNDSCMINSAHLWGVKDGCGVLFHKGAGAMINNIILDSVSYGFKFDVYNLGFPVFISNVYAWSVHGFLFHATNQMLLTNVYIGTLRGMNNDDIAKLCNLGYLKCPAKILNSSITHGYSATLNGSSVNVVFNGLRGQARMNVSNITLTWGAFSFAWDDNITIPPNIPSCGTAHLYDATHGAYSGNIVYTNGNLQIETAFGNEQTITGVSGQIILDIPLACYQ